MNNLLEKKATTDSNPEVNICLTNTTKSSKGPERVKFAVERDYKNNEYDLPKNKTNRSDNFIQRRSKHDQKGRDYLCSKCWKSYLSYAAIYVHLKKKHRITIKELKTGYLKRNKISPSDLLNQVRAKKRYKNFEISFEKLFESAYNQVFCEDSKKYSEFLEPDNLNHDIISSCKNINVTIVNLFTPALMYKLHPLFSKTQNVFNIFQNKELLEKMKNSDFIKNIDDAISVYLFASWNFNNASENILNLKIAFIFREYLNFIGWENLEIMAEYQIIEYSDIKYSEDFTKTTLGSYLPELLDDFIGVYLKNGCPDFDSGFSEVKEFISDLCNMLYNEELISYMIEPQEEMEI